MRNNSLLMSLLANSSANPRASSMMHKDVYSNPYTSTARSSSLSNVSNQMKSSKLINENSAPLVRMVHFLNLKVRNQYYFFFCKLEHVLKNRKKVEDERQMNEQPRYHQTKLDVMVKKPEQHLQPIKKDKIDAMRSLCDSLNTFKTKRESLQEKELLQKGFRKIVKQSNLNNGLQKLKSFSNRVTLKSYRLGFINLKRIQKERIRNQILFFHLNQLLVKQQAQSFILVKAFAKEHQKNKKMMPYQTLNQFKASEFSPSQFYIEPLKIQLSSSKHQDSEKTNRSKKIILRQRKISTNQPISFVMNKNPISISFDVPLSSSTFNSKEEKMNRCINTKSDQMTSCLSDLSDNCNLFRDFQLPLNPKRSAYTIENFHSNQLKELSEFDSLTDRSWKNHQSDFSKSMKNTPKYLKDKASINLTLKKQVSLSNHDMNPVTKIDQILSKIQQMKSFRSIDRSNEKKMVSLNVEKNFQMNQSNANKIKMKTPNRRFEECQKENIRERLITERQKPQKKSRGLQTGSKYKSTILNKSKDQKQGFTAKKMKTQIENIINRRNKQLYYRVQSTQLN